MDVLGDGAEPALSGADATSRFAGRYALGRALKCSNGVDTFLAVDTFTGTDVVLKSIDPLLIHAAARLRFEHETHVLRQLTGPGLTGLHDAGLAEDRLYLVQPLVPGALPPSAMAQLAESMAGPLPDKAISTVVRLADGSPFMGAAVLRGLVECGALVGSAQGWLIDD